jgi:antibiotic biosynthesis monooxygenase (ABM) superfamily enzyme
MGMKVTIKRQVRPGKEAILNSLLIELRSRALTRNGYMSGETLVSAVDHSVHLVIGTWSSVEDWKSWESHPDRQELIRKINDHLVSEPHAEVWLEHGARKESVPFSVKSEPEV